MRGRLSVIVLVSLLPAAIFASWDVERRYRHDLAAREADLLQSSRFVANDQHGALTTARALLTSLAGLPEVRSFGPACNEIMTGALASLADTGFAGLGVVDATGRWRCGFTAPEATLDVSDHRWFADIKRGRGWAASELLDGRPLPFRGFILAVPLQDGEGARIGAVSLLVDAERFARSYRSAVLGQDAVFVFLDRDDEPVIGGSGALESGGALPRDPAVIPRAVASAGSELAVGRDGRWRLYAVVPLYAGQLRVLAGITLTSVHGPLDPLLALRLAPPLLMLLLAAVCVWVGVDRLVVRWLRYLRATTRSYAGGSTAALPVLVRAPGEIRQVAADLARMAQRIESREQALRKGLAHRELLVREVHHRVKNSLQMVMSLLSLHARRVPDGEARRGFADAGARLAALALVHRRLYEAARLEEVDVDEFLRDLCKDLEAARPAASHPVELIVTAAPLALPAAIAVPLGLLVNEAVMNAYKHAFAGRDHGCIEVTLENLAREDRIRLSIRDDGVGHHASGEGLGMTLIRGFAQQMGGTAEVVTEAGTEVRVVFERASGDPCA